MKKITLFLAMLTASIGFSQPTTDAPTPPARGAADVISIYGGGNGGNPYTDITGVNYAPNWGQPAPYTPPNPAADPAATGNTVLFYPALSYQGTDFAGNSQNASGMESLHLDIWTATGQTIKVTPINGGGGATGAGEFLVNVTTTAGQWVSVDINKSQFTGMTWDRVFQLKIETDGQPGTREDVYLDNIYFWKTPLAAGSDATLSDLQLDNSTIPGFVPSAFNYNFEVVVGTTPANAPQITTATTTDPNATFVIAQATTIPGDATVTVTSQNGNVTETYTISFEDTRPNASPTPPAYPSHLAVIADIVDTGSFTNFWEPDDFFGAAPLRVDLDPSAVLNKSARLDLSIGWGGGITAGGNLATTDLTTYDTVHIDYFIPSSVAAGVRGHQFYLDLISRTNNANTEAFYGIGAAIGGANSGVVDELIVFDSWVGVDIPMSTFVAKGFDPSNFFQFKIGAESDLNTQLGYFDNLYFYDSTIASNDDLRASTFSIFPNPSNGNWNVNSTDTTIDTIQLYDLTGKLVISKSVNAVNTQLDGSQLSAGLYIARISSATGVETIKLIKE